MATESQTADSASGVLREGQGADKRLRTLLRAVLSPLTSTGRHQTPSKGTGIKERQ